MPLVCSADEVIYDDFEFIDCQTLNISYDVRGIATISFSVVTPREELQENYTSLIFGGVNFKCFVNNVTISKIPGTLVNNFQMQLTGFGC